MKYGWITDNIGTITVSIILAAVVAVIMFSIIKKKKNGGNSCGCSCQSCPMGGSCHKNKTSRQDS